MQNKTSLIFDQAARHSKIKRDNEEQLSQTLKLYQQYGKIDDNNLIATILDSLQQIEFFKQNCPEGMKLGEFVGNAIKYFKFEQYDYGFPIFHYGEYGEVQVFGPKPQEEINRELEQLKLQDDGELIIKGQKRQLTTNIDNLLKIQDQRYYKDGVFLYQKIFQYYSGQCFGDVALTSDKPRSATVIVSSEKLFCLSMRRNDFKIIFQKSIQQARNTIEYFMKIFPGALQFNLSKFIQYLRPIVFQSKTVLWQIGDEPQFFFIIVSGRVELYKYMDLDQLSGKQKIKDELQQGLFVGKQQYKAKIVLSQLAEGNIVGQEELLEDCQKRQYYCEAVDITNAYYMEASDFRAIQGNHQDIIDCLKERAFMNKDYIKKRKQLILQNFKNYDLYLNSLNQNQAYKEQKLKEIFSNSNKDNKSQSICVRSHKQIKGSQIEILQQHIAFDCKRKLVEPQEKSELKFIINNNNLSYIRERLQRQQQPSSNSQSPQKHVKNKVLISQILKKYQNKKMLHEKKDKKKKSIFVTSSQSSIGQTIETENSFDLLKQKQRTSILRPSFIKLRGRKQSGEKSINNNTTIINLTEVETRTHQQTVHQITNFTHLTPSSTKFFKTIRSISGK